MKQISDKVNLAVRRCKNKGKKITVAEARDSKYLDKLVQLDEGYYIFRQLRNSPAYLEARKKDIFAMIRQLSLPTWFMSLSAADTRWTDLLRMLARLNEKKAISNAYLIPPRRVMVNIENDVRIRRPQNICKKQVLS